MEEEEEFMPGTDELVTNIFGEDSEDEEERPLMENISKIEPEQEQEQDREKRSSSFSSSSSS